MGRDRGQERGHPDAPGCWTRAVGIGLILILVACDLPVVDARAVWVDEDTLDGSRTLHVYTRGDFAETTLRGRDDRRDATRTAPILELAPRGRGLLVMSGDSDPAQAPGGGSLRVGYLDLDGLRGIAVDLPRGARLAEPFFTARGDALGWADFCGGELGLIPLGPGSTRYAPESSESRQIAVADRLRLGSPDASCPRRFGVTSARDAPVLFAIAAVEEGNALIAAPGAEVIALRYPGEATGEVTGELLGQVASEAGLVELGRTALHPELHSKAARACGGRVDCLGLVDPDGAALSILGALEEPCRLWRWSWIPTVDDNGAEEVLPAACVYRGDGHVLAAISPDHYVIRRGTSLFRYNWRTGAQVGLPLLGHGFHWSLHWRLTADGRAVAVVTRSGFMVRLSPERVEVINLVQTPCAPGVNVVFAPSGRWAAWTCRALASVDDEALGDEDGGAPEVEVAAVVRASVDGLERYDGVPMWAVAIDDRGDVLLYSRANARYNATSGQPTGAPRNLYVLQERGTLTRVSPLQPAPALSRGLGGAWHWVAATGL